MRVVLKCLAALFVILVVDNSLIAQSRYITLKQPDGTTFKAVERGEQFLHFYETPEGYIVRKWRNGYYYYFNINSQGKFVKMNIKAGSKTSIEIPIKPYNNYAVKQELIKQIEKFNKYAEHNREIYLAKQRRWLQSAPSLEKTSKSMMPETNISVGILLH